MVQSYEQKSESPSNSDVFFDEEQKKYKLHLRVTLQKKAPELKNSTKRLGIDKGKD